MCYSATRHLCSIPAAERTGGVTPARLWGLPWLFSHVLLGPALRPRSAGLGTLPFCAARALGLAIVVGAIVVRAVAALVTAVVGDVPTKTLLASTRSRGALYLPQALDDRALLLFTTCQPAQLFKVHATAVCVDG